MNIARKFLNVFRKKYGEYSYSALGFCHRNRLLGKYVKPTSPSFLRSDQHGEYKYYGPLPENYRNTHGCSFLIAAFPKSGNVWLTSLIAGCLDMPAEGTPGKCFVHHTHTALNDKLLFDKKLLRGVVLIRDVRDIVVSLFHFMKTDFFKRVQGPHHIYDDIDDMYTHYFIRFFADNFLPLKDLPEGYIKYGWPVIKYEKLYDHPEKELKRLFKIWEIDVDEKKISEVIKANTISSLRKGGGTINPKIESTHFRKGGYGNYKNELPEPILRDIEYRFGDYLRSWGYEI